MENDPVIFKRESNNSIETGLVSGFQRIFRPNVVLIVVPLIFFGLKVFNLFPQASALINVFLGLVFLQALLLVLLRFFSQKVNQVEFTGDSVGFELVKAGAKKSDQLKINASEIFLFENKNQRSHLAGLRMYIYNDKLGAKYKIYDKDWSYPQMEAIYNEFKKRKNESVSEDEIVAYEQLQILTGRQNPTSDA